MSPTFKFSICQVLQLKKESFGFGSRSYFHFRFGVNIEENWTTPQNSHKHEHELGLNCNSMVLNFEVNPIHPGLFSFLRPDEGFGAPLYNFTAAQDRATKTKQNNVLVIYNIDINIL